MSVVVVRAISRCEMRAPGVDDKGHVCVDRSHRREKGGRDRGTEKTEEQRKEE
jgi:hypothetical protein